MEEEWHHLLGGNAPMVNVQDDEMRRYVAEELESFEEEPRYVRESEKDE
ncbi:hypothetical protein [Candidatus Hakubella thermalkaliphila]|nr:hypothetical protein [Candidatus Hakubella thermalkaliphila]